MVRKVDPEVLAGFIQEARSYLPAIRAGIEALGAEPAWPEMVEEAYRHIHTIKGASSMVGVTGLSRMAYELEAALEESVTGSRPATDESLEVFRRTVVLIENYLDGMASGAVVEESLVAEVSELFRRLRGASATGGNCAPSDVSLATESPAIAALAEEPEADTLGAHAPTVGEVPALEFPDDPASAAAPEFPALDEPAARDVREADETPGAQAEARAPSLSVLPEAADDEDISPELREVFTLEAEDHLRNMSAALPALEQQPDNKELLQEIRRSAHTLKGSAAMVGFRAITQLAHRMEDLLDLLYEGQRPVNADVIQLLFASTDALEDLAAGKAQVSVLPELYARYTVLLGEVVPAPAECAATAVDEAVPPGEEADHAAVGDDAAEATAPKERGGAAGQRKQGQFVRVPIERLDELVKLVSELVISRTAFEQRMTDLVKQVEELQPSTDRLRRVAYKLETEFEVSALGGGGVTNAPAPSVREGADASRLPESIVPVNRLAATFKTHGFDDLEFDRYTEFHLLTRELAETTNDVQTVNGELRHLHGDFDTFLNRQGRLSSEIEDKLMQMRMVPLATLAGRLQRAVRNVATQQHKEVDLFVDGEHTELDKTVLEAMADPLLHILRNAVDHGIEPPELRVVRGKHAKGAIRLRAYHEGSQIVIQVSDDGGGVDLQVLRATAVARGFVAADDAGQLTDEELRALVFLPGFSTADEVSEVSGRGVGLDIVKAQVHKLKGSLVLDSAPGAGTTFTIRLPLSLAVTRALLVKANQEIFAIPLDAVLQIVRVERADLEQVGQEPVVRLNGEVYPLVHLGRVLGLKNAADESVQRPPVLVVNAGGKQIAVVVDHLLGGREIVIKNLGGHLRHVHGVSGATLLGDGSVVLIINPAELARRSARQRVAARPTPPAPRAKEAFTILVVDDSPSVRRVVSTLIKSAGWQPVTAKDGVEALEILQSLPTPPDLVVMDVEMPRMDGYELLATLRGQEAYGTLPVVMVTSRAGDKHRRKAIGLGASAYVVKPYQDQALLNVIRQLVRDARQPVMA
jgi:chemosensory pili system protein ChpA (sensor histidine kinase/response regulator)